MTMDRSIEAKNHFIRTFVATFLASYEAVTYQENCSRGWVNHHVPAEDAEHLAEQAWEEMGKL